MPKTLTLQKQEIMSRLIGETVEMVNDPFIMQHVHGRIVFNVYF